MSATPVLTRPRSPFAARLAGLNTSARHGDGHRPAHCRGHRAHRAQGVRGRRAAPWRCSRQLRSRCTSARRSAAPARSSPTGWQRWSPWRPDPGPAGLRAWRLPRSPSSPCTPGSTCGSSSRRRRWWCTRHTCPRASWCEVRRTALGARDLRRLPEKMASACVSSSSGRSPAVRAGWPPGRASLPAAGSSRSTAERVKAAVQRFGPADHPCPRPSHPGLGGQIWYSAPLRCLMSVKARVGLGCLGRSLGSTS